jgi:glycosyltransferase involved in cell wall biosynthesis
VFLRSDAVVALAPENVEEMEALGFPAERIFPMTNGVSTERFRPDAGGDAAPREGPPRAVFMGRLAPEKGLADLLSAWDAVRDRAPGARLEIYGDGPQGPELQALAAGLGVQEAVTFHGDTRDVRGALLAADVLVLPSYSEGNSNAMLEAMACGLPVVAYRVGGAELMVGPAGAEWLVDVGDRAGLADRLGGLLASPATCRELGRVMHARIHAYFEIGVVADAYLRVYRCLAAGERTRVRSLASPLFSP